ncbi:MAG TPA: hypothetical protein VE966_01260, partial [Gemmatimonadales bacterium]|nr:hypothetical protein [Gemmatimonadales bacterium]
MSKQRPEDSVQPLAAPPLGDRVATALRGFGPLGILALLVILLAGNYPIAPLGALLALAWVRWS